MPKDEIQPEGLFDGVQAQVLKVIDIPGVEDSVFAEKIIKLIKKKKSRLLPIFLLNLDAGTANLQEFQKIREIYKDTDNLVLPVIFTKLSSCIKNARSECIAGKLFNGIDAAA
jgi:hypothetical protein